MKSHNVIHKKEVSNERLGWSTNGKVCNEAKSLEHDSHESIDRKEVREAMFELAFSFRSLDSFPRNE